MQKIANPIIKGMAPDPSIIRVDEDYYIATSTFHWNPAVQIFHSKDLANWKLISYALTNNEVNLRGTNTPAGIWAPHLSYDSKTKKYWLAYSHMQNMAGREFNSDSFAVWSDSITGPWSKPIYLTSIGFDPALFHDENGKHYVSILEWETRTGYQAPGHIVIAEVDLENGSIIGDWHRVTNGFTTRGCAEAPQIYKHDGYYYLLIAAGGTGYAHGVEMGRSKNVFGPYEPDPSGEPIITSSPHHIFSLGDPDAGHFEMYNPNSIMQKAGHGSLVQTQTDEWYITHLMSRPLPETKLNPLGRETSIQKMVWKDGWLQMADGSNLAKMETPGMTNVEFSQSQQSDDINDHFDQENYDLRFMTPYREQESTWVNTTENPHHLRIYGNNSFFSQVNPAIMATRATSFDYSIETKVTCNPNHYSEAAGIGLYYDSNNWLYARLCLDDNEEKVVLRILQAKLGDRTDDIFNEVEVPNNTAELKIEYLMGNATVWYKLDTDNNWQQLGTSIDVSYLSDEGVNGEPGEIGGFTALFNFLGTIDAHQHDFYADFDYYTVKNN
ncbi:family 43 glycosylhydrolase [Lactobacillus sp. YT155]|uniref:family 43 glycosylhydrolase n=1 Tax=Lactobacillus sp. YT155 TaxID=3060955 RepID=UPI00265DDAB6|nr:family 43 glycosylhydrolase [Lactobacillus sp. YT155]MDO1605168.1 family 43 glycosylhydrolase [Lactobacillus sp. YT155]